MKRNVLLTLRRAGYIAVMATAFVAVPAYALISNPVSASNVTQFLGSALKSLVSFLIPIIVLFFVVLGLLFVAARGNPEKLSVAKNALLYTAIGAGIILGAWAITQVVRTTIGAVTGS